ncbi:unnamed protein product [Penicillium salamii]|nr:unnamed protein product [Penicillium salamii]
MKNYTRHPSSATPLRPLSVLSSQLQVGHFQRDHSHRLCVRPCFAFEDSRNPRTVTDMGNWN